MFPMCNGNSFDSRRPLTQNPITMSSYPWTKNINEKFQSPKKSEAHQALSAVETIGTLESLADEAERLSSAGYDSSSGGDSTTYALPPCPRPNIASTQLGLTVTEQRERFFSYPEFPVGTAKHLDWPLDRPLHLHWKTNGWSLVCIKYIL